MSILILLACLLTVTWLNAWYHYILIEEKKVSPNHKVWALYRLTYFALSSFVYSTEWQHILSLIFLQASVFWIVFDVLLNQFRDLPWNYVGKSAWIDKLFAGKWVEMMAVKLILLFFSIVTAIILL